MITIIKQVTINFIKCCRVSFRLRCRSGSNREAPSSHPILGGELGFEWVPDTGAFQTVAAFAVDGALPIADTFAQACGRLNRK